MATQITVAAKKQLRKEVTAHLRTLPPALVLEESRLVVQHVLASSAWKSARNISIYLSTPIGEIQTDDLVRAAFAQGKALYVPFCPLKEPTVMRMLRLQSVAHFENLALNRWGIRELNPEDVDTLEDADSQGSGGLDLVLVPGLAFDNRGARLGHGRGYYDRVIAAWKTSYLTRYGKSAPQTLALALRDQILDRKVPTSDWDQKPDSLFTADGLFASAW